MEREAKIFESGEYEDKGLTVTEEELEKYVDNFKPCPVKIEHSDTALDGVLGTLKKIYKKGKELFGTIDFIEEAWALMEKAGAKKLSVSLNPENYSISEVSIVKEPRVADARVFCFNLEFKEKEVLKNFEDEIKRLQEENLKLWNMVSELKANEKVEKFMKEGKITPANKDYATQIFKAPGEIKFGTGIYTIPELFGLFLEKSPKMVDFGELKKEVTGEEFSSDQKEIAEKLGVKL